MTPHPLSNWIPYKLSYDEQAEWLISWLDLEHRRMVEPFFDETIQISRHRNIERSRLKSYSSPEFLTVVAPELPHLKPTAFIFHVSRCGSTLLTQAFCEAEEHIVIAEAPLLDEILRANEKDPEITPAQQEEWFKAALQLMGQRRNFKESDLIVKLDSWHLHFYPQLRNWFPGIPFIFLFRKPEEVLASHEKRRGIHSVPNMISSVLLGIDPTINYNGDYNRYTADVIEQYFLKLHLIHQQNHALNFFADYGDGISPMISIFTRATGIKVRNPDQLKTRLNYHSKSPDEVFQGELPPNPELSYPHCSQAYQELRERCSSIPFTNLVYEVHCQKKAGKKVTLPLDFARAESMWMNFYSLGKFETLSFLYTECNSPEHLEEWIANQKGKDFADKAALQFRAWQEARESIDRNGSAYPKTLLPEQIQFWEQNGYLVIPQVVEAELCDQVKDEISKHLNLDLSRPETWYTPHLDWQGIMLQLYQNEEMEQIRYHRGVRDKFAELYQSTELIPNTEKVGYYPPETQDASSRNGSLHWDLDLSSPIPFHIQGLVYLDDVPEERGPLQVVPGFHRRFEDWMKPFSSLDAAHEHMRATETAKPASGKKGDLVLWLNTLPHSAGRNQSALPRFVQYLSFNKL